MTPNDVNVNRNTSADAASTAGRSSGHVTVRHTVAGDAPSVRAACA